ncbi:DUF6783 domain-containing protein [Lachnospiraceae bacterium 45-P1]
MKIHSRHQHAPLCGIFGLNSLNVAHYAAFICYNQRQLMLSRPDAVPKTIKYITTSQQAKSDRSPTGSDLSFLSRIIYKYSKGGAFPTLALFCFAYYNYL